MREIVGDEVAQTLERMARAVYALGENTSRGHGIIIADTKFEFGRDREGRIILIDEVMTPDSSRFWAADAYRPGRPQPVSTSSRCAIISTLSGAPAAGTAKPRPPHCPPKSLKPPASVISTPIAASPALSLKIQGTVQGTR